MDSSEIHFRDGTLALQAILDAICSFWTVVAKNVTRLGFPRRLCRSQGFGVKYQPSLAHAFESRICRNRRMTANGPGETNTSTVVHRFEVASVHAVRASNGGHVVSHPSVCIAMNHIKCSLCCPWNALPSPCKERNQGCFLSNPLI